VAEVDHAAFPIFLRVHSAQNFGLDLEHLRQHNLAFKMRGAEKLI
jgi:hypothetical protein